MTYDYNAMKNSLNNSYTKEEVHQLRDKLHAQWNTTARLNGYERKGEFSLTEDEYLTVMDAIDMLHFDAE